jgi:hypothetical protein
MKKLGVAIAAACALAVPGAASANHVAGLTYTGTVSTGSGGTVTIQVANDGQSLSFQAQNIGNGSSCTGVSFGPITEIPISNHSFSYLSNDGLISASGSFDSPGHAGGSAQVLTTPCTTGSQAWTATAPSPGADALISRVTDNAAVGDDVYNTTGVDQTRKWSAKRGQARTFDVVVENAGTEPGRIDIKGCGSSRGFKVRYESLAGANVTSRVLAGTFGQNRDPGATVFAAMIIKPTRDARIGKTKVCKATGISDANRDVVRAELKVRRG